MIWGQDVSFRILDICLKDKLHMNVNENLCTFNFFNEFLTATLEAILTDLYWKLR